MKFLFEAPGLAFFDCGGVRLMLSRAPRPDLEHASSILYYFVDDIRGRFEELRRRGVAFAGEPHVIARMPDHELWLAEFRDSEGNVLALMSEVRG
jgi:methylmalonyl-CoA/ethylmalonyl-CoA epimerase